MSRLDKIRNVFPDKVKVLEGKNIYLLACMSIVTCDFIRQINKQKKSAPP